MASGALSRRVSEFAGVVLFGCALMWVISLASYSASDPVWFFNTGTEHPPANFAGLVGAFIAEASFQVVGYASYLIPAALVVLGWHYFWCRPLDAIYTKFVGTALLFTSLSGLLALAVGNLDIDGHAFRAGGSVPLYPARTRTDRGDREAREEERREAGGAPDRASGAHAQTAA